MGARLSHQQQMPRQMHQWMPAESPQQLRQTQRRWTDVDRLQDHCSMSVTGGNVTFGDAVHRLVTNVPDDAIRSLAQMGFIVTDRHPGKLSGYLYKRYFAAVVARLPSWMDVLEADAMEADAMEVGSQAVHECATPVVVRGDGDLVRQMLCVLARVAGRA
jgi:hypothetical protein